MKHKAVTAYPCMDACSGIAVYRHSSGKYSKPERKCSEYDKKQQ